LITSLSTWPEYEEKELFKETAEDYILDSSIKPILTLSDPFNGLLKVQVNV